MRILQVNRFYANRGGAETVLFQTIRLLQRHGDTIVPFSMEDGANPPSGYSSYFVDNVDLRRSGTRLAPLSPGTWPLGVRALYSREAAKNLEALVRASRPDLAHLHSIYHQLSPSVLAPLRRHGIPTVLTLHDYKLVCPSSIMFTGGSVCERCKGHKYYNAVIQGCVHDSRWKSAFCASEAYLHTAMGAYRRNIDMYISPSRFLKQKMVEFGVDEERIVHVSNPINLEDYEPGGTAEDYFLFAGRLEEIKGVEVLLDAVAGSDLASRYELRIVGDGSRRAALERYCRKRQIKNVRFLGWKSQAELADLHRGALFAIVPSIWYEVFSLAVLEAQAFGKAVIGADIGGIPELIENGRTGLLFEPGNAVELRSRIEQLLSDPEATVKMGRAARAVVEENCTPDRQYRRLMAVYEQAMHSRALRQKAAAGAPFGVQG